VTITHWDVVVVRIPVLKDSIAKQGPVLIIPAGMLADGHSLGRTP
jgi:hypothetical protein